MAERVWLLEPKRLVPEVLEQAATDIGTTLHTARRIVVKPNLCGGSVLEKDHLAVTSRAVMRATLAALRRAAPNADILVAESDSTGNGFAVDKFERQGYSELVREFERCRCLDLTNSVLRKLPFDGAYFSPHAVLPVPLLDADVVVSVAKMKTHTVATMTGATKNLFGCLPEREKSQYHPYLSAVLLDLVRLLPRTICVVEGCPGMEGAGPMFGSPVHSGGIVVGSDPLVVDLIVSRLMGMPERSVPLLRSARHRGILRVQLRDVQVIGSPIATFERKYAFVSREQTMFVRAGIAIQALGQRIERFGHFLHNVRGTRWALGRAWLRVVRRLRAPQ